MATQKSDIQQNSAGPDLTATVKSATQLSLLQLNDIRLDIKHTILTPQYLESLEDQKASEVGSSETSQRE